MRFLTLAGIILLGGPLMASSISYVTTDTTAGGGSNNYDSVTGLDQHPGSCFAQGSNSIVVPCATLTSTPSTNILGLTSASVATNATSFDPQNGVSGFAEFVRVRESRFGHGGSVGGRPSVLSHDTPLFGWGLGSG